MAVAAYASVLALMRSLDNALLPRSRPLPNKSLIETLQEKVGLLQESLELLSPTHGATDDSTIRRAVREADDLIDKCVVDQLRGGESDYDNSTFCEEIQALIQGIESANEELKAMATMDKDLQRRENPSHERPPRVDLGGIDTTPTVGFEHLFMEIKDDLTDRNPNRKVIGIVGMGGTGKTILARQIYSHVDIDEHFDLRSWVTVSKEFDVRELLFGLIGERAIDDSVDRLRIRLHQTLFGRRYLIVMDDVWSAEAWDELVPYLPDNNNGSRILITTREQSVMPSSAGTKSYTMNLLGEEDSWRLFCEKVFGRDGKCPSELEEIGKEIVRRCGGLPLAIVIIAASASKFGYDRSHWEDLAENLASAIRSDADERVEKIVSLSYNNLPIHLKLCFISMVEFTEDSDIEVSRLVELWVAAGIVKPTGDRNMEEVAVEYIEDLVGRNMVMAVETGSRGNIKTCAIHDLLRDIRESQGESYLHVPKVQEITYSSLKSRSSCFLCGKNGTQERFQLQEVLVGSLPTTFLNPTVCDDCAYKHRQLNGSRSVRVVERVHDQRAEVPQVTKLTSLSIGDRFRFYSKQIVFASPSPVSLLWNLQRLYFHVSGQEVTMLLSKIWEMPQLRYLHLLRHALPEPEDKSSATVLQHLTTLKLVKNLRFTLEVVRRIPNLVRLSVLYDPDPKEGEELDCSYYSLDGLELFRRLQELKLACRRRSFDIRDVTLVMSLRSIAFPPSLVKLTLMDCKLSWKDMSVIGSLPNLEVLKLERDSFVGEEWCTTGTDEFPRVKYLKLEDLDLVYWKMDVKAFDSLTKLKLFGLYRLVEIPSSFGDLPEIQAIHASFCTQDVVEAVMRIKEEREDLGCDFRSVIEQ